MILNALQIFTLARMIYDYNTVEESEIFIHKWLKMLSLPEYLYFHKEIIFIYAILIYKRTKDMVTSFSKLKYTGAIISPVFYKLDANDTLVTGMNTTQNVTGYGPANQSKYENSLSGIIGNKTFDNSLMKQRSRVLSHQNTGGVSQDDMNDRSEDKI